MWNKQIGRASIILAALSLAAYAVPANAQTLAADSLISVTMSDSSEITLYSKVDDPLAYYYLPTNLRVANGPTGKPLLTLLTYLTQGVESTTENQTDGGALSAFVTWGMTQEQRNELATLLERKKPGAKLEGAVPLATDTDSPSVSLQVSVEDVNRFAWSGRAPTQPGGKVAIGANLSPQGASLIKAGLEEANVGGVLMTLEYLYHVQAPAIDCTFSIRWSDFEREFESASSRYSTSAHIVDRKRRYSYSEVSDATRRALSSMNTVQDCTTGENVSQEAIDRIEATLGEYIANKVAQRAEEEPNNIIEPEGGAEGESETSNREGRSYIVDTSRRSVNTESGSETFTIKRKQLLRRPHTVTGDINAWIEQLGDQPGVLVESIDLSTSEFQSFPVIAGLSSTGIEMLGKGLDRVNVIFRKPNPSGIDYTDNYAFQPNGETSHKFIHKRGTDRSDNANSYQYEVEWYFRNASPVKSGIIEAEGGVIDLQPPLRAIPVEFQVDQGQMGASRLNYAEVEILHPYLGRDHISTLKVKSSGADESSKMVYVDPGAETLAYRMLFAHPVHGILATDWEEARVRRDRLSIYGVVPDQLGEEDPDFIDRAKEKVEGAADKALNDLLRDFGGAR